MKRIVFWFDPISPFAYLAFLRLPGQAYKSIQRQILAMERERGARA